MPVSKRSQFDRRSALLVGISGVLLALLVGGLVLALARSGADIEIRIGDSDFRDLDAARISAEIAERGPVLFSDVAGGRRDLILQHLGDDPATGWLAFEARRSGQRRDCFFQWRPESRTFVNSCDSNDIVDQSGSGLMHYPVSVNDGEVRVDINPEQG